MSEPEALSGLPGPIELLTVPPLEVGADSTAVAVIDAEHLLVVVLEERLVSPEPRGQTLRYWPERSDHRERVAKRFLAETLEERLRQGLRSGEMPRRWVATSTETMS